MGIRRRRVVGLPRAGSTRLEPPFAVVEILQDFDGLEERAVHWDASGECAVWHRLSRVFVPLAEE